jgi:hypothetical protein
MYIVIVRLIHEGVVTGSVYYGPFATWKAADQWVVRELEHTGWKYRIVETRIVRLEPVEPVQA